MPAATDWIEALRAAVWATLDANTLLDPANRDGVMAGGTKVKFEPGLRVVLVAERSQCPILAMLPLGDVDQPMGQRGERSGRSATLHFELYGAGPTTNPVTRLYAEVIETLRNAAPSFGLADTLTKLAIANATLDPTGSIKDANTMFVLTFDLVCTFRVCG